MPADPGRTVRRPRAGQPRGQLTQDAILDAALDAAGPGGSLAIADVIARSGASVGSVYHHFGSLDGLRAALFRRCMCALLDRLIAEVTAHTAHAPPCPTPAALEAGIRALVRAYLGWTREHPRAARFLHGAGSLPPAEIEALYAGKAPRLAALQGWLLPYVAAGLVAPLPPDLYELLLIGPLAEAARRWLADAPLYRPGEALSPPDLDRLIRDLPPRLIRAIAA